MNNKRLVSCFVISCFCFLSLRAQTHISDTSRGSSHIHPEWVKDFPVIMVGDWDMKPIFRTRVGGAPLWFDQTYQKEHTEERVKQFKQMGATMLMLHFYKGFGLNAEKEEIEDAKKLSSLCRKYGLKVGAYIGATMAYETFLAERPDAKSWIVPPYEGRPVTYGNQYFRKLVYFQNEGYKDYIRRVLRIAINDLKVDLIHFDNTSVQAIPPVFYHPDAVKEFRAFLYKKYTPRQLKRRLGFSDLTYMEAPVYIKNASVMNDPLQQEWMDFRAHQLSSYYAEMADYIHGLNPGTAVECNPHGLSGENTVYTQSVDFPRLLSHTDFFWTESEKTGYADGLLLSKIRTFKMARTLHNRVFVNVSDSKLEMAESLAYNQACIGQIAGQAEMIGGRHTNEYSLTEQQHRYIKFFHDHFSTCYAHTRTVADIAVFHGYASMAYNSDRPYQSTFLFEQSLIQHRLPFDIIFDQQLNDIGKYKVLILADQECLDDGQLARICRFVDSGGTLIATENTSLYTENRQQRADFGLYDLLKVHAPKWQADGAESLANIATQHRLEGKGKVVYIPEIYPAVPKPAGVPMAGKYLKLPLNDQQLIQAVDWALDDKPVLSIETQKSVTAELQQKDDNSYIILHLVNYDTLHSVSNIAVKLRLPAGLQTKDVRLISPDNEAMEQSLSFNRDDNEIAFTVPSLSTYDIVMVRLK